MERQNIKIEEMRQKVYKKELKPLLNEVVGHLSKKEFPFLVGQKVIIELEVEDENNSYF